MKYKITKKFQSGKSWYVPKRKIYILWLIPFYYKLSNLIYSTVEGAESVIYEHSQYKSYKDIEINRPL
jgi:hypothetical protein